MSKLKILSIIGTRPEAVKMAPIIRALSQNHAVESRICLTAQHREMLDQVLTLFGIQPDFDLNLMRPGQSPSQLAGDIFHKLDPVLAQVNPDWILVQGDTTTVMAASIAAFHRQIKVGHVEAGLRTLDKWHPFPEEINRRIASVVADLHFAPTPLSKANLLREGIPDWRIAVTGNPVIDALNTIAAIPSPTEISTMLNQMLPEDANRRLILVTAHRRENFGEPLRNICNALSDLASTYAKELQLIYPVHLNPNVRLPVHEMLKGVENITLVDPLDYLSLVHIMKRAFLILTDSGGIQEEAAALRIPTLVLRNTTERPEGLHTGILKLVGTERQAIVSKAKILLEDPTQYQEMKVSQNPFGDGHASERIVDTLINFCEPAPLEHLNDPYGP